MLVEASMEKNKLAVLDKNDFEYLLGHINKITWLLGRSDLGSQITGELENDCRFAAKPI